MAIRSGLNFATVPQDPADHAFPDHRLTTRCSRSKAFGQILDFFFDHEPERLLRAEHYLANCVAAKKALEGRVRRVNELELTRRNKIRGNLQRAPRVHRHIDAHEHAPVGSRNCVPDQEHRNPTEPDDPRGGRAPEHVLQRMVVDANDDKIRAHLFRPLHDVQIVLAANNGDGETNLFAWPHGCDLVSKGVPRGLLLLIDDLSRPIVVDDVQNLDICPPLDAIASARCNARSQRAVRSVATRSFFIPYPSSGSLNPTRKGLGYNQRFMSPRHSPSALVAM